MYRPIPRIVFVLLQAAVLTAALGSAEVGQTAAFGDSASAMPVGEFQPAADTDTPNGVPVAESPPEIGPLAQTFGTARSEPDNFPPPPSRGDAENATITAIKALADQVKSLESRIAAQDARIALLERALDDVQHRSSRFN
ncbi:MAG TPA: hypothetical protein VGK44_18690 [Casimicrobiaceae bacterium]|jgi:hypothetical protein